MHLKRLVVGLMILPAAACTAQCVLPSAAPDGLESSWFHDDCAPFDGPATSLYLGDEAATNALAPTLPYLRVALYTSSARFPINERLRFEIPAAEAHAEYCPDTGGCTAAEEMTIEFSRIEQDVLEGRLEALFADRAPIRGGFRAARIPFEALCG